jgi:alkylated DNA nucleotide flippase Atl1
MGLLDDARKKRLAGETTSYEARLVRSDGQVVYVHITGSPRWQEGKVLGSLAIITNLTDHYIVEQERRIYERTAALARTNEILLAEIVKRRRAEEILNMSVNEKEVLLRKIHHKVKNNLQLISSLLYIQSKKAFDERPQDVLQDFQNRVKSMAMVHETLSRSHNLAEINLVSRHDYNVVKYI